MAESSSAIVIGTGQAGPSLAARLANAGMRVAIIERKLFGGTCVNTGCIPTKTLVASAYAIHMARRGDDFGFEIPGPVTVDMKRVKARKDEISGRSRVGVETWLKSLKNCTTYEGHARFTGTHEVEVGDQRLSAEQIFINVGGRALIPDIPGLHDVPYLDNSSMMEVDFLPQHLLILGGSYIGLEFGHMYRRFGSEVTIIENGSRLISREDEDTSTEIKGILESEGIRILLDSRCSRVAKSGGRVTLTLETKNGPVELSGSHLLIATGRQPNTADLGLEAAGVVTDKHGYIQVDDELRTNVPGVWALGDCNGRGAFTHTSYNDYEIVAANLFAVHSSERRRVSDRIPVYALYTDPPLGRVGMTKADARKSGRRVMVGRRPMTRVGRAVEKGEDRGFMEILVDADTHEILGAAILGPGGDEAIHCIIDLMYVRAPYPTLQRAMHIHPTVSELLPTIAGELQPL
jgi:pyruvate/2-oxoglutarate dehydrogenase complex dihydrolipoamide dehydrogenase (E3) component